MIEMRGLSLWQPYASLKVKGIKINETRSWETRYRGLIAFHAAKKLFDTRIYLDRELHPFANALGLPDIYSFESLPYGAILGYGELVDCHLMTPEFIAKQTKQEIYFGDWGPGRFAWEFKDMVELPEPIPYKGMQGLWRVKNPDEILIKGRL